jgi:tetratricopeptide (TPR) repeat protein
MTDRLTYLLKLSREMPSDAFIKYGLALEYVSMNDDDTALGYFRELYAMHRDYLPLYYQLGKLYERNGKEKEAIGIYDEGIIVARNQKDMHTLNELQSALDELY